MMPISEATEARTLYYVHDPMCSWCWAFRPVWAEILQGLPTGVRPRRLLGGLAPDTEQPMPEPMQARIHAIWRQIQKQLPATRFNFDFWQRCTPRRSTYPACRAVIAARSQGAEFEESMILAIQQAYYLEARNPSDQETLADLADRIGLDNSGFVRDLDAPATQAALEQEMQLGRHMGARGFPSLLFQAGGETRILQHDYRDAVFVLSQLQAG